MNNIRNKLKLSMTRGIPYAGWPNSQYDDDPRCMDPNPPIFVNRMDVYGFSVNLLNHPL